MKLNLFLNGRTNTHIQKKTALNIWGNDKVFVILCAWFIAGVFVDGWAHNHLTQLETFFTPWHALLYSGMMALAGYLVLTMFYNHHYRAVPWLEALPPGYGLSLWGTAIFFVGGVADMTWHIFFGIEKNIEALLSPTHLLLAFGATWIVGGPLRAAMHRKDEGFKKLFPAILSLTYILTLITFFTQYANPIVNSLANVRTTEALRGFGLTGILLQTIVEMCALIFFVQRWKAPFGTFALIFMVKNGLSAVLANNTVLVVIASSLAAALIGLLIDGLYRWLQPSRDRRLALPIFAFLVPIINESAYFVALHFLHGVVWPINLWLGAIVMSGLAGLLLSYLLTAACTSAADAKDV